MSLLYIFAKKSSNLRSALYLIIPVFLFTACTEIHLYEKHAAIPGHEWKADYKPQFTFDIQDTTAVYDVMLILRHTEKYGYNNIWLKLTIQPPNDSSQTIRIEKTLATNKDGWLATAMDDIYDHRISINNELAENNVSFKTPGEYTFTLQQDMREDPLLHIMNAGLRVEKKQ